MDNKNKTIAIGVGALAIGGIAYAIYKATRGNGSGGVIHPSTITEGGDTPPGLVWDESTETYIKITPESDFKILSVSATPTSVSIKVDAPEGKIFNVIYALGHWYPTIYEQTCFNCGGSGLCPPDKYTPNEKVCCEIVNGEATDKCVFCHGTGMYSPIDALQPVNFNWGGIYHKPPEIWWGCGWWDNIKFSQGTFVPEVDLFMDLGSWGSLASMWYPYGNFTSGAYMTGFAEWAKLNGQIQGLSTDGRANPPFPASEKFSLPPRITNVVCEPGYYFGEGNRCIYGTAPEDPIPNVGSTFDLCVLLYEHIGAGGSPTQPLELRDYVIIPNAIVLGAPDPTTVGTEEHPFYYNRGWQGVGYYTDIPSHTGMLYVATIDTYNTLFGNLV